jgi:hypothetical protein
VRCIPSAPAPAAAAAVTAAAAITATVTAALSLHHYQQRYHELTNARMIDIKTAFDIFRPGTAVVSSHVPALHDWRFSLCRSLHGQAFAGESGMSAQPGLQGLHGWCRGLLDLVSKLVGLLQICKRL